MVILTTSPTSRLAESVVPLEPPSTRGKGEPGQRKKSGKAQHTEALEKARIGLARCGIEREATGHGQSCWRF